MSTKQLELAFRSLDFPGRTVLAPGEIAQRLGISTPQVYELMNEQGEFDALDVSRPNAKRKTWRIPIEAYRNFIVMRLHPGRARDEALRQLPRATLEDLKQTLERILAA